jgi:hypothetical protein
VIYAEGAACETLQAPHRDLYLSRYHCMYLDGVLIPAVDLLNDSTITRCSAEDLREVEYFHILSRTLSMQPFESWPILS